MSIIEDQQEVVRMLVARDEMNAAVHMTTVRLSPVTEAAERVLAHLTNLDGEWSDDLDWETQGTQPHKYVRYGSAGVVCNVVNCITDDDEDLVSSDEVRAHPIHQVTQ